MEEIIPCHCGRLGFELTVPLGQAQKDPHAERRKQKGDTRRSVGELVLVCRNCSGRIKVYADNNGGLFLHRPGDVKGD